MIKFDFITLEIEMHDVLTDLQKSNFLFIASFPHSFLSISPGWEKDRELDEPFTGCGNTELSHWGAS